MITNASALLKQYHNPVGPKPSNPTLPGPQMGPGLPGPVGGSLGGPSTTGLGHGPGMGPSSLTSGLGASSSSQVDQRPAVTYIIFRFLFFTKFVLYFGQ